MMLTVALEGNRMRQLLRPTETEPPATGCDRTRDWAQLHVRATIAVGGGFRHPSPGGGSDQGAACGQLAARWIGGPAVTGPLGLLQVRAARFSVVMA